MCGIIGTSQTWRTFGTAGTYGTFGNVGTIKHVNNFLLLEIVDFLVLSVPG